MEPSAVGPDAGRRVRRWVLAALTVTALLAGVVGVLGVTSRDRATAQPGGGTAQYFLRIDGIPGESTDAAHKDQIELVSYEWGSGGTPGLAAPATGGVGTGNATGKPQVNAIGFRQDVSRASTALMVAAANGRRINEATLFVRKSGEQPVEYLTMKLSDVIVSSYRTAASAPGTPVDEFTLTFGKVDYSYVSQSPSGALTQPVTGTWDFRTNSGG